MKLTPKYVLLISISILIQGCVFIKYSKPKNETEKIMLAEFNQIVQNIASVSNPEQKDELQQIKVKFSKINFQATSNGVFTKILLPENNAGSTFTDDGLEDYLDLMCQNKGKCKIPFAEYITLYYTIHELYHIINVERYNKDNPDSFVKHPTKNRTMMSFDEEIRAERVLVKYLHQFDRTKLEELKTAFSIILRNHQFENDYSIVKSNWNTFKNESLERDLTKISIFSFCAEEINESSLEELLFQG